MPTPTVPELAARVAGLLERRGRVLVGVTGEPGAGKSTLAQELTAYLNAIGVETVTVPMDGFHLAGIELERLGRAARKGALDTFDGWGYVNLLLRLRGHEEEVVYAPVYDRTVEETVAGAVAVSRSVRVVVTEGNYLLADAEPWREVPMLLDEVWYLETGSDVRRERLVARHLAAGKPAGVARRWVELVDEPNAAAVRAGRASADLVVRGDG